MTVIRLPALRFRVPQLTLLASVRLRPDDTISVPLEAFGVTLSCPAAEPRVISAPAAVPVVVAEIVPDVVVPDTFRVSALVRLLRFVVDPRRVTLPPLPLPPTADIAPPAVGNIRAPSVAPNPASSSIRPPAPAEAVTVKLPKELRVIPPAPLFLAIICPPVPAVAPALAEMDVILPAVPNVIAVALSAVTVTIPPDPEVAPLL